MLASLVREYKILSNLPDAGTKGLMFGEIFGRKAGEIAADAVPCLFLLPRTPALDSDRLRRFESSSGESTCGESTCGVIAAEVLGVLDALSLADFADRVGVLCSSPFSVSVPAVSIVCSAGRTGGIAESGNKISSMILSSTLRILEDLVLMRESV